MVYQDTDKGNREDVSTSTGYNLTQGVRDIQEELRKRGFMISPRPGGLFAGWDVYQRSPLEVPGLKVPRDFTYYRKLTPGIATDRVAFEGAIESSIAMILKDHEDGDDLKQVYINLQTIRVCFLERSTDQRSPVALLAQSRVNIDQPTNITINGASGALRVAPRLDWFPQEVQDLDPVSLLTLFPEAERDALMMLLGRLMLGANGTETLEGPVSHSARAYGVIVGVEPGMGKSTLLDYIIKAIQKLGYTATAINSNFGKFGWGEVAVADLAYIDDLTHETQRQLLKDSNIKSLVSNNNLRVEEKGIASWTVRSKTVILGCTNHTDPGHLIGIDPGCLSRLNQLDTYSSWELAQKHNCTIEEAKKTYRLREYWEATAKRLGCTTELLAMRLLRGALDAFMTATGHYLDNTGALCKDMDRDHLEMLMANARGSYRIDVSLSHAVALVQAASELVSLAIAYDRNPARQLKRLENSLFDHKLLYVAIETFYASDRITEPWSPVVPTQIAPNCRTLRLQELKDIRDNKSLADAFTGLASKLTSVKGYGYPKSVSHYQQYWDSAKRFIPERVLQWSEVIKDHEVPNDLAEILSATVRSLAS